MATTWVRRFPGHESIPEVVFAETVYGVSDVGACQMLIDGKIKLKNDSTIKRYTKTGFEFQDGSTVDADVILFATGCVLRAWLPIVADILYTPVVSTAR